MFSIKQLLMSKYKPVDQLVFRIILANNKSLQLGDNKFVELSDPVWQAYHTSGGFLPFNYLRPDFSPPQDMKFPCRPYPLHLRPDMYRTLFSDTSNL